MTFVFLEKLLCESSFPRLSLPLRFRAVPLKSIVEANGGPTREQATSAPRRPLSPEETKIVQDAIASTLKDPAAAQFKMPLLVMWKRPNSSYVFLLRPGQRQKFLRGLCRVLLVVWDTMSYSRTKKAKLPMCAQSAWIPAKFIRTQTFAPPTGIDPGRSSYFDAGSLTPAPRFFSGMNSTPALTHRSPRSNPQAGSSCQRKYHRRSQRR